MDGRNSTGNALGNNMRCSAAAMSGFYNTMDRQIWLGNALLLASAGVTAVLVGIGGYGWRYRHHPLTRFIFFGANTLFLPIISYVVSTLSDSSNDYVNKDNGMILAALCYSSLHPCMVVTWAFLVQITAINTASIVAIDNREGQKVGPPLELLVKGIWIFYLGASITKERFFRGLFQLLRPGESETLEGFTFVCSKIMFAPFVLICAKILFKIYAFGNAQVSFTLGRNPSVIFGYMQQLHQQEGNQQGEPLVDEDDAPPPPLLVTGEDRRPVEKQPRGYVFSGSIITTTDNCGLVTLNKVWQSDNVLPTLTQRKKDLCLSFALFKLLRCHFARYKFIDSGSTGSLKFFWSLLLKDGEHDRVFRVVGDELSFIHDYYYSSLPISYIKCWLPILSIFISLLSIVYCIVTAYFSGVFGALVQHNKVDSPQITCKFFCRKETGVSTLQPKDFGNSNFDVVPVFLVLVLVLISEVRDMASYICSNWTKVALICHYVNRPSTLRDPLRMDKWVGLLLQFNCKIMRHWNETIGQCSVLVLHPRTTLLGLVSRLLRLPDQKSTVKVPEAVKGAAATAPAWARRRVRRRRAYVHHKIAATHLSRYCAYLVTWSPELLPDDAAWSSSLYDAVKKDVRHGFAGRRLTSSTTPEAEYQMVVDVLGEYSKHEVLKNGVSLGKQLVELAEGEGTSWKLLAGFWSEMILFVAPSENLKGHSEAIARGGELITLLWAMLFHAGIVSRPGEDGDGATAAGVAV
ncbi:hypothetical protein EJB05_14478, partial [Eragrostis curvula]